jgi:hypothetical protein
MLIDYPFEQVVTNEKFCGILAETFVGRKNQKQPKN